MPNLTDDELAAQLAEAKKAGAAEKESEVGKIIEGTTFKSLDDMRETAVNAAKKVSEHSQELGELRKIKDEYEKIKKEKPGSTKTEDDDPKKVVDGMTDEEGEYLDKQYNENPAFKQAVDAGGVEAQAEALKALREEQKKRNVSIGSPFKKSSAGKGRTESEIRKMIQASFIAAEKSRAKGLGGASPAGSAAGKDGQPIVRGSMDAFRKT